LLRRLYMQLPFVTDREPVSAPSSSNILDDSDSSHPRHHHSRRVQYNLLHCIPFADSQRPCEAWPSRLDRTGRPNPAELRPSVPGIHIKPPRSLERHPLPKHDVASKNREPGTGSGRGDGEASHTDARPHAWIRAHIDHGAYVRDGGYEGACSR
jgi:hypothetical protein